ncbi:MAG: hypothetical protein ACOX3W_05810 [Christensenellaceae bacterium]|jgi:hypothetical protein
MMRNNHASGPLRASVGAMFSVLSLITLYLAVILPSGRLALYFIASIFTMPLLVERQPVGAILQFVVTSVLALLIVPDLSLVLPYILLFGHYGIGKYYFEKMRSKIASFIAKLLYFNTGMLGVYFLSFHALGSAFLAELSPILLALLVQIAFVVYDFLYSKVSLFYEVRIRSALMRAGK